MVITPDCVNAMKCIAWFTREHTSEKRTNDAAYARCEDLYLNLMWKDGSYTLNAYRVDGRDLTQTDKDLIQVAFGIPEYVRPTPVRGMPYPTWGWCWGCQSFPIQKIEQKPYEKQFEFWKKRMKGFSSRVYK